MFLDVLYSLAIYPSTGTSPNYLFFQDPNQQNSALHFPWLVPGYQRIAGARPMCLDGTFFSYNAHFTSGEGRNCLAKHGFVSQQFGIQLISSFVFLLLCFGLYVSICYHQATGVGGGPSPLLLMMAS